MNNGEITGTIDTSLVNIHMMAAAKPCDRRPSLQCLHMECKCGILHLVTTDGRIMLHTTKIDALDIKGEELPDFVADVKITGRLKRCYNATFTVREDCVVFRTPEFTAFEINKGSGFTNYSSIEAGIKPSDVNLFKLIKAKYLAIVERYLGDEMCPPENTAENSPVVWHVDLGDVIKRAYTMPLRLK